MSNTPSSDLRPTYIVQPSQRFATSFLDNKYRDYAVPGEAILDKVTGELFLKRPIDGRIISFDQNKKNLHDVLMEMRVILANNTEFIYPDDDESICINSDYSLLAMNNEIPHDVLDANELSIQIDNESQYDNRKFIFALSKYTNGFLCKPMSRDSDKPFIEFMSGMYNHIYGEYKLNHPHMLAEKALFDDTKWKNTNARISFKVKLIKLDGSEVTVETDADDNTYTELIRINESMYVSIHRDEWKTVHPLSTIDHIIIEITSIDFYKLRVLYHDADKHSSENFEPLYIQEYLSTTLYTPNTFYVKIDETNYALSTGEYDPDQTYYSRNMSFYEIEGDSPMKETSTDCPNKLYYTKKYSGNNYVHINNFGENNLEFLPDVVHLYVRDENSQMVRVEDGDTFDENMDYYIDSNEYVYTVSDNLTNFEEGVEYYEYSGLVKTTSYDGAALLVVSGESEKSNEISVDDGPASLGISVGEYVRREYILTSDTVCHNKLYFTRATRYVYIEQKNLTEFDGSIIYYYDVVGSDGEYEKVKVQSADVFDSSKIYYTRSEVITYKLAHNLTEFEPDTDYYYNITFKIVDHDIPVNTKNYYTKNGNTYELFTNITVFDSVVESELYDKLMDGYQKFMTVDSEVQIPNMNIIYFVDEPSQVIHLNNETIISLIDRAFMINYIRKIVASMSGMMPVILSATKPDETRWMTNTAWCQNVTEMSHRTVDELLNDPTLKDPSNSNVYDILLHQMSGDNTYNILFPITRYANILSAPTVVDYTTLSDLKSSTDKDMDSKSFHFAATEYKSLSSTEIHTLLGLNSSNIEDDELGDVTTDPIPPRGDDDDDTGNNEVDFDDIGPI